MGEMEKRMETDCSISGQGLPAFGVVSRFWSLLTRALLVHSVEWRA